MLLGCSPFGILKSDNEDVVHQKTAEVELDFGSVPIPELSIHAREFLGNLLKKDATKRMSIRASLQHVWISQYGPRFLTKYTMKIASHRRTKTSIVKRLDQIPEITSTSEIYDSLCDCTKNVKNSVTFSALSLDTVSAEAQGHFPRQVKDLQSFELAEQVRPAAIPDQWRFGKRTTEDEFTVGHMTKKRPRMIEITSECF